MNLALTDDQVMIRDAAASFLADACEIGAVRATLEGDGGFDERLWNGITELGWCGTAIPEKFGGSGLGPVELALILEQVGRRLCPAPFLSSVLAANLVAQAGTPAAKKKYLPALAQGTRAAVATADAVKAKKSGDGWALTGRARAVPDASCAQLIIVRTRDGAFALPAGARGLTVRALPTWDGTRRLADVQLKGASAERIDDGRPATRARAEALARVYVAAEQLGGAQECLDLTLRYILERKQFGRAIASFQAVKHRCAQMMVQVESLRSAVYGAAACAATERDADAVAMDCAMARALAADAFFHCSAEAIQLHGGVGFTWEFAPHLYFKRAQATSHLLGTASQMREQIAQALL